MSEFSTELVESSEESGNVWVTPSVGGPPVRHDWDDIEAKEGLYFKIYGQWFRGINVTNPYTGFVVMIYRNFPICSPLSS